MKQIYVKPTTNYDTSGTVNLINGIPEGYNDSERTGRVINIDSIDFNGYLFAVYQSAIWFELARTILIWDKSPNGSVPAVTDILEEASPLSLLNIDNSSRFNVLYDNMTAIGPLSGGDGYVWDPTLILRENIPIGFETVFSSTGSAITDIASGSLLLLTIGDDSAGASSEFHFRVWYEDH